MRTVSCVKTGDASCDGISDASCDASFFTGLKERCDGSCKRINQKGADVRPRSLNMLEKHEEKNIDNVSEDAWEAMPRPLVIDSGAAETVITAEWFPLHDVQESHGYKRGVY